MITTEKAIQLLHRLSDEQFDGIHGDERREALEMAVRALSGDGDLISRKAVMKEFSDFVRELNNSDFAPTPTWNDAVSLVGSMPSTQPESIWLPLTESDIDHLFDYYAKEKDENLTEQAQLLKECMWVGYMAAKKQPEITEDDVKEYCRKRCLIVVTSDFYDEMYRRWVSTQPRKKGKWIDLKCNQCGQVDMSKPNYCPICGADMRGESDED